MSRTIAVACLFVIAAAGGALAQSPAQPASAATQPQAAPAPADAWPKTATLDGATYTMYQPQLDRWDKATAAAHVAVSVQPPGGQSPVFGVLKVSATTRIDKLARTVYLTDLKVTEAMFPSAPTWAASYGQAFGSLLAKSLTISLDRIEAALAVVKAQDQSQSVPVANPVPQFVFSPKPAVLVTIDGDPAWRKVAGTSYERVLNTRPLLLRDGGTIYFHLFDGFLKAPGLAGPWSVATFVPPGVAKAASDLAAGGAVDPMDGPADETSGKKPSLASGAPDVIVATQPTELIVTDGAPDWVGLEGSGSLLYVKNTDANVFVDMNTSQTYVLVSGRWFASKDLKGPWANVPAKQLPQAFFSIPDSSPKENVKAAIPGTTQAKEALIATQIPQMAQVDRAKATFYAADRGHASGEAGRGHRAHVRRERAGAAHRRSIGRVVRRREGGVVHRAPAERPMDRGDRRARRDLRDSAELAGLLRDLRPHLRGNAHDRDGRLPPGLHGHVRQRRNARVRHRLRLRALHR